MKADRIVLEPSEDGRRWRVVPEGDDVEGHIRRKGFSDEAGDTEGHSRRRAFSVEPDGEQNGEPVFRVMLDGEDVEGHARHFRL